MLLLRLYNRMFVCSKQGHIAPTMKAEHYGGPPSDHCLRCGGYLYAWRA